MALPRTSVRNFLVQAKNTLRTARSQGQKVTFVIGNESADLDSFAAAILYAYIRSSSPRPHAAAPFYVPITNLPAADIQLRPEFLALLPYANLEREHIITLDDLPQIGDKPLDPENTQWILVDHNALQGNIGLEYSSRVVGAIDHHDDENVVPMDTGSEPRIITKTGSCCSLVTNYCREAWDALSSSAQSSGAANVQSDSVNVVDGASYISLWDAQVAKLALAAILIDTTNLDTSNAKSGDKVTAHDVEAVKTLESKIASSPQAWKDYNRDQFFKEISDAKKDISPLKLYDILRKDYKQWTEGSLVLGVSSVVRPFDFLIKKAKDEAVSSISSTDAFVKTMEAFAADRHLDIMAVMTSSVNDKNEFQRELLVWSLDSAGTSAVERFEKMSTAELDLVHWYGSVKDINHEGEHGWRKIWRQNAVQHSRKRVAPLLRDAMN